jgi:hypothetical protein
MMESTNHRLNFFYNLQNKIEEIEIEIEKPQKDEQKDELDGWLTYSGWVIYGELRSQLDSNLEYRKKNPHIFKSKNNEDVVGDYLQYILYNLGAIKDDTISKIIPDAKKAQKPPSKLVSFETWKKNQKLRTEWENLTVEQSRLLQLEKQLQEQHSTSTSNTSNIYKHLVPEDSGMMP